MAASVKDKSHFGMLMTADCTGFTSGAFKMNRRVRGVRDPVKVDTFPAHQSYLTAYNGADKLDRGHAEFPLQHTNRRYYIRIFWWTQELVISSVYQYVQAHVPRGEAAASAAAAAATSAKKSKYKPENIDFLKYASGTNTTSARAEFMVDLSASLADLGRRLDQERPAALLADAAADRKAGGVGVEARREKLLQKVIEAVDVCVLPTTVPGHDLYEVPAMAYTRCDVCEHVALEMLPLLEQAERRKRVTWARSFCVGCSGGLSEALRVMCAFCHDHNWDHVRHQLKPREELRLVKAAPAQPDAAAAAAAAVAATTPTASAQKQRRRRRSTSSDDAANKRKTTSPKQVEARCANLRRTAASKAGDEDWCTEGSESEEQGESADSE